MQEGGLRIKRFSQRADSGILLQHNVVPPCPIERFTPAPVAIWQSGCCAVLLLSWDGYTARGHNLRFFIVDFCGWKVVTFPI